MRAFSLKRLNKRLSAGAAARSPPVPAWGNRVNQKYEFGLESTALKIAIILSDSVGCKHDLEVISSALIPLLKVGRDVIMPRAVPWEAIHWEREVVERRIKVEFDPDCVFFIEAMIEHSALLKARHRILLPNPDWLEDAIVRLAGQCNHIWHKSRASFDRLEPIFPSAKHAFVGFTSCDPGRRVVNHTSFLHARGNVGTRRNTKAVLQCWNARSDLPSLYVTARKIRRHRMPKQERAEHRSGQ
jgi:hypothetical protein